MVTGSRQFSSFHTATTITPSPNLTPFFAQAWFVDCSYCQYFFYWEYRTTPSLQSNQNTERITLCPLVVRSCQFCWNSTMGTAKALQFKSTSCQLSGTSLHQLSLWFTQKASSQQCHWALTTEIITPGNLVSIDQMVSGIGGHIPFQATWASNHQCKYCMLWDTGDALQIIRSIMRSYKAKTPVNSTNSYGIPQLIFNSLLDEGPDLGKASHAIHCGPYHGETSKPSSIANEHANNLSNWCNVQISITCI